MAYKHNPYASEQDNVDRAAFLGGCSVLNGTPFFIMQEYNGAHKILTKQPGGYVSMPVQQGEVPAGAVQYSRRDAERVVKHLEQEAGSALPWSIVHEKGWQQQQ